MTKPIEPERFTSNAAESQFAQWATGQGWYVTKRGWPDFICRRGNERMAVEVKHHDTVSGAQHATIMDLSTGPIACYIWRPPSPRCPERGQLEPAFRVGQVMSERRLSAYKVADVLASLCANAESLAAELGERLAQREDVIWSLRQELRELRAQIRAQAQEEADAA